MYQGFLICTAVVVWTWIGITGAGYNAWFVHTAFAIVAAGNLAFHASIMYDAVSKG
jgi:hypothetical protein